MTRKISYIYTYWEIS